MTHITFPERIKRDGLSPMDRLEGIAYANGLEDGRAQSAALLSTLRDLIADCDDVDDGKMATVSAASLTRARQAVAKAEG